MEYKFPISLPRFADDDMKAKKAAYASEHGYYISPPKLSDIVHIRFHKEPDDDEFDRYSKARRLYYLIDRYPTSRSVPQWKKERADLITPSRYYDVADLMQRKRDRYKRMVASPAPTWLTNAGSVMTFFDDVNDFAGTAAVVCRIAARFAPKLLSRFFLGPAGWLLLVADIFGLLMSLWRLPLSCIGMKRHFGRAGDLNPFSKKAKVRRARKLRKVLPGKGELIEAAQVTDQLFGIGLCLGPLVGFAQDIVSGTVRTIRGEKVTWRAPPPKPRSHEETAFRVLKFAQVVGLAKQVFTEDEHWLIYIALNGATQVIKPYRDIWDPFDQVEGLEHLLFEAPTPKYATTKAILEEFGVDPEAKIGWPGLDKTMATAEELWDYYQAPAAETFFDFCIRNRRNARGSTGAQNAFEFAKNMLLLTEGYETVDEEFLPQWDGWYQYHENGCVIDGTPAAFRLGSFNFQENYHRIGNKAVTVVVSCISPRRFLFGAARRGMYLDTRTCRLWFDPSWGYGDCRDHVFLISVGELNEDSEAQIALGHSKVFKY